MDAKPFEWMVQYTSQQEWGLHRGIWLWLALVLGGLGSGLYCVALYHGHHRAMAVGWFIAVVLKGLCHLSYLGKPLRAWRAFTRPQSSWVSRGLISVSGFGFFAGLQMLPIYFPNLPWSGQSLLLNVMVISFALFLMIYPGFLLSYVHAIPLWNNALIPVIFVLYAFLGGLGLFLPMGLAGGLDHSGVVAVEKGIRLFLLVSSGVLAVYLISVGYTNPAGRKSLFSLLTGSFALTFYGGVVFLGILIPLFSSLFLYFSNSLILPLLYFAMLCELIGSFLLRLCLLKAGIYMPLVSVT